jgi:hypothetical protein
MAVDVNKIKARYNKLKANKQGWLSIYQQVADYVSPVPRNMNNQSVSGGKRNVTVLDTTATEAAIQLAHSLNGALTNPTTDWFLATISDANLANQPEVSDWLEKVGRITNHYLQQTNFGEAMIEVYTDLLIYGTGGLLIQPNDLDLIRFEARNVAEFVVAESSGRIDTIFREVKKPIREVVEEYGAEKLHTNWKRLYKDDPDKEVTLLHCIMPRRDADYSKRDKKSMPIASIWIDMDNGVELEEGGFQEDAMIVARWARLSGDVYGYSPAMQCLNDILVLNKIEDISLKAKQIAAAPPVVIDDDSLLSEFKWQPFSKVYKKKGGAKPEVLNLGVQPQLVDSAAKDRREQIRRTFFADIINIQSFRDLQYVTAQGVQQGTEERERILTSVLGRLQSELLEPIITRVYGILSRKGVYPPVPQQLVGKVWRPVWTSPLARKQQERKADAIARTFGLLGNLAPFFNPQNPLAGRFDGDALAKEVAEVYGLPRSIVLSDYTVKTNKEAAQQAQDQMMQQQQMMDGIQKLANAESVTANTSGPVNTLMNSLGNGG